MLSGITIQELSITVTEQLSLLLLKARLQLLRMEKENLIQIPASWMCHVFIANLLKPHFSKSKPAQLPALTGPSPVLPAGSKARSSFASGPACVV